MTKFETYKNFILILKKFQKKHCNYKILDL